MNDLMLLPNNTNLVPEPSNDTVYKVAGSGVEFTIDTLDQFALSESTRKRYFHALKQFYVSGFSAPCSVIQLRKYIALCITKYKYSTINTAMSAISFLHIHGYPDHPNPTKHPKALSGLKAAKRLTKKPPVQKTAMTQAVIKDIFATMPQQHEDLNVKQLRDKALILMGYYFALRRSEIAKLNYNDVEFTDYGITLTIAPSKHDEEVYRVAIPVNPQSKRYCLVAVLKSWIAVSRAEGDDSSRPLFRGVTRGHIPRTTRLDKDSIGDIIKSICQTAGFDNWDDFSGHSMRRGYATQAHKNGIPTMDIAVGGRWNNLNSVKRYIDATASVAIMSLTSTWD